jgi:Family of unknown function (DUF6220)
MQATGKEVPAMVRVVETPGVPARVETIVTPPKSGKRTGLSIPVRLARIGYAVICSVFVACVLLQVFFAGMGAFGANWSWHVTFVLEPLPLLMVPMAFVGRLSWVSRLLPLGLLVLIGGQYALANTAVPSAALHPVNALLIFLLGLFIARRAWAAVAGQRR